MLHRADSFEWCTAAQLSRFYTVDDGSGSVLVGPHGRGGGPGLRFSGDAAAYIRQPIDPAPSGAVAIIQADIRIASAPAAVTAIFRILQGSTVQATLAIGTDRKLQVYRGDLGTALGSASTYVVPLNTFISLGLKLTINNSTGAALVHVWAPGDTAAQAVLNLTGQNTRGAGTTDWDGFDVHAANAVTTDYCNLIVADGSGSINDDLFGTQDVITLRPNDIGDSNDLTRSSGLLNYPLVADAVADDSVTYVKGDAVDEQDLYHFQDAPNPDKAIAGVVTVAVVGGSGSYAQIGKEDSTEDEGPEISVSGYGASAMPRDLTPSAVAWTPTRFNATQFGVKVKSLFDAAVAKYVGGVESGNWDDLDVSSGMTIVVRLTMNNPRGGVVEKTHATTPVSGWSLAVDDDKRITFLKFQAATVAAKQAGGDAGGANFRLIDGVSTLVCVTYDPNASHVNADCIKIYYDALDVSVFIPNVWSGTTPQPSDAAEPLNVGSTNHNFPGIGSPPLMSGTFDGDIDCILGFNRILTTGEMETLRDLTAPCASEPELRATQIAALVVTERSPDPEPVADPDGDGTVGASTDPDAGIDLCGAETIVAWADVTPPGGAMKRYPKVPINQTIQDEPRMSSFGIVSRGLTNRSGDLRASSASCVLHDADRALRALDDSDSLVNALVQYYLSTEAAIKAGSTPRRVFSGLATDSEPLSGLLFRLQMSGHLQALLDITPTPTYPRRVFSVADFPNLANDPTSLTSPGNPTLIGKAVPVGYGVLSDESLGLAAKGIVPAHFVGKRTVDGFDWDEYVLFAHAPGSGVLGFFADIFGRTRCEAGMEGVDFLWPGFAGWNAATGSTNTYRDYNGNRYTTVFARGPRSDAARDGRVPFTVNIGGIEDVGDGSGLVITSLARQVCHLLINWVLQTYTSGAWLSPPLINGLYSALKTSTFEACKDRSEDRISGGHKGAFVLGWDLEPVTLSDISRIANDHGIAIGENKDGQLIGSMVDPEAAAVRSVSDIHDTAEKSFSARRQRSEVANTPIYRYGRVYVPPVPEETPAEGEYLPSSLQVEQRDWEYDEQTLTPNSASVSKYGTRPLDRSFEWTRDAATAADLALLHQEILAPAPVDVRYTDGVCGTNVELGNRVNLDHFEGPTASGYTARPIRAELLALDLDNLAVETHGLDMANLPGSS